MNLDALKAQLINDEGMKLWAYKDTKGLLTIGVGRLIDPALGGGITKDEAMYLLGNDIVSKMRDLDHALPWWRGLNDARQNALINCAFNLGIPRLLGFKKALAAMQIGDYKSAAREMLDSAWHAQVGDRAVRLAKVIETGVL